MGNLYNMVKKIIKEIEKIISDKNKIYSLSKTLPIHIKRINKNDKFISFILYALKSEKDTEYIISCITIYKNYLENYKLNEINENDLNIIHSKLMNNKYKESTKKRYWSYITYIIKKFNSDLDFSRFYEQQYEKENEIDFSHNDININKKLELIKTMKLNNKIIYNKKSHLYQLKKLTLKFNIENEKFLDFLIEKYFQGISESRITRYIIVYLKRLNKYNLNNISTQEAKFIFYQIKNDELSSSTKSNEWIIVKQIISVFNDEINLNKYSIKVEKNTLKHSDLLTDEDKKKILGSRIIAEKKAFIYLLFETGMRVGECFNLNKDCFIKDVDTGYIIRIPDGKTGARTVYIVDEYNYIANILKNGWEKWNISYVSIRKTFRSFESKINKRLYPHLARHSFATNLATKVNEQTLKQWMGWVPGSKVLNTYLHLNNDEAIKEIKRIKNIS